MGTPFFVVLKKKAGACPCTARPNRILEAAKRKEFPAEKALVMRPALTTCGSTNQTRDEESSSTCK